MSQQVRFGTLVVDPPWHYGSANARSSAGKHYPTMRNEEIAALPVGSICADTAHLYLWVTNPRLFGPRNGDGPSPLAIVARWGFEFKTMLTWVKSGAPGMGFYFRGDTEHVLFCTRGKAPIPPHLRESNVILAPRGRHSQKPAAFYDKVERVSPAPRVEIFAREPRLGWESIGNEIDGQSAADAIERIAA